MIGNKKLTLSCIIIFLFHFSAFSQNSPNKEKFSIPKMSGNIELNLPINLYCKPQEKLGFFNSFTNGWASMNMPTKNEVDFTFRIKSWSQLTKQEVNDCSVLSEEYAEYDTRYNTKVCAFLNYPSKSVDLIPTICTPYQYKDGPIYLECKSTNNVIDLSTKSVIGTPSAVELLFNRTQSLTKSICTETR